MFLLLTGCGALPNTDCKWTLSGAATGSGGCTSTTTYKGSIDQSEVAIVIAAPGASIGLDAASVVVSGKPTTGTFTSSGTSSVKGGIVVENTPVTSQWAVTFNDGMTNAGDYTLNLTSSAAGLSGGSGDQFFTTHGTISGNAPPSPAMPNSATGTVSISITF